MKKTVLFLFFTSFGFYIQHIYAYTANMVEVEFQDPSAENLPPKKSDQANAGDNEKKLQAITTPNNNEAEIQLVHGDQCQRQHGHSGCGQGYSDHYHSPPHGHGPPIIIVNPAPLSTICRKGLFYCVNYSAQPVGSSCACLDIFGNIWFWGQNSLF